MNYLAKELDHISKKPDYGSEEYKNWVAQNNFVDFLQNLNNLNSIVLYAGAPFPFIYGVLVPERLLAPPNVDDLEKWDCDPFSSWGVTTSCGKQAKVYLSDPLDHSSSKIFEHGEKILFVREFDGRQEQPSYIELSQKFTHSFDLHYVPERNAYCRFDERGDIEDVVKEFLSSEQNDCEKGRVVTILRRDLDEYMVITRQAMVLLYDSTRYEPKKFGGWQNCNVKKFEKDPEIYYKMGENPGTASYLRGFQIIRSRLPKKDILMKYGICQPKHRKYETFIAHDWKNNKVCECSCDPRYLGNYFVKSDFPYETSPVFFRPEVLQKYKGDTEKYKIQHRSISCRHSWHLQTYDINETGQVHTYLIYLSYLPFEEQLYWKSFNEPPKGSISQRAYKTDFKGEWDSEYDPLQSLGKILQELNETKINWWILREKDMITKVHYPVTDSADEWAKEIHNLHKLLIEGFEISDLRNRLINLGGQFDSQWKSLKLIKDF